MRRDEAGWGDALSVATGSAKGGTTLSVALLVSAGAPRFAILERNFREVITMHQSERWVLLAPPAGRVGEAVRDGAPSPCHVLVTRGGEQKGASNRSERAPALLDERQLMQMSQVWSRREHAESVEMTNRRRVPSPSPEGGGSDRRRMIDLSGVRAGPGWGDNLTTCAASVVRLYPHPVCLRKPTSPLLGEVSRAAET